MTHTKGPWQARVFLSPVGTFFISDSMGQLLFGAGKPLTEANARLIAAAPELLTALYETLAALETHLAESARDHSLGNVDVLCPCSTNEVVRARAAIAKAKGRQ